MHPIEFINADEDRNGGKHGEPSLGEALNLWRLRWTSGLRDRETALHLMFLSWYSCAEPPYFTGLPCSGAFKEIFLEAFESLSGKESGDVEVCYVVGVMASLFPWCLGKDEHWTQVGAELLRRVGLQDSLRIQGVTFANRGKRPAIPFLTALDQ